MRTVEQIHAGPITVVCRDDDADFLRPTSIDKNSAIEAINTSIAHLEKAREIIKKEA